jgi:3-methyladenine DNA glycosylase AlkC
MPEPLKNMFNRQTVSALAAAIQAAYPDFQPDDFLADVFDANWNGRELKQRVRHITTVLQTHLPPGYESALTILRQTIPNLPEQGFEKMVFPDFVEVYGLDDFDASIEALERFTQFVSAEFAIRPFIQRYPQQTMRQMLAWAAHEHPGVRRLASEGCRPRLPWGMGLPALKGDPAPILPILELLKLDESESVRRSVANNLNDISKDNPDVVIDVLRRWQELENEEIRWTTSHALRTLIKQGHPDALELLGYPSQPQIAIRNLTIEPDVVPMGSNLTISFAIESLSDRPQNLMIDYVVHLMRKNGKQTPKVFKLSKKTLPPGEVLHITKKHSFAPVTTRKYYPGAHAIEPKVNGQLFERIEFVLIETQ